MSHSIDLDKVRLRKDKLGRVVHSYLKDEFADMIVNVECHNLRGVSKFRFFIDVDYCRADGSNSFYNRKIKKEVTNLCKYILSGNESFDSVSFFPVIHAVITP
jgi:hypothetical protein